MDVYNIDGLIKFTLASLETENPGLYAKFIDAVRSGDTRRLTTDEINDLIRRHLFQKGITVRAVVQPSFNELVRNAHEESNDAFLGEEGYLKSAKNEMPELVEKLVSLLNDGETISNNSELLPLEKYHLVFTRASDSLLDVHIMARTHLAYSTLQNIRDTEPKDF